MVIRSRGQAITEYIVMLGLLTLIGAWIMKAMTGAAGESGAIKTMSKNAASKIADDK